MTSFVINPAPLNTELLYSYQTHRAFGIFHGQSDVLLDSRRGDQTFWAHVKRGIPDGIRQIIDAAGFKGVFDVGYLSCDDSLITAIVERWRPETHTFHLPFREVTITLEDVQLLWGLNVQGDVVSGVEVAGDTQQATIALMQAQCRDYLGFTPEAKDIKSYMLSKTRLLEEIHSTIPYNDNEPQQETDKKRARCYILYALGFIMFANKSGLHVHLNILNNIIDLNQCRYLSWGSAVLACMYRNLCKPLRA